MEKSNKMYSFEIVDKAISAVGVGFSGDNDNFKKSLEGLPKEIKAIVIASILEGLGKIRMQMENPAKEAIDKMAKK